ncbi:MAG: phage major capsid protein, partial [Acidobacteriota bacterium]
MSASTIDFKTQLAEIQKAAGEALDPLRLRLDHVEANLSRAPGAVGGDYSTAESTGGRVAKCLFDDDQFAAFRRTGKGRLAFEVPGGSLFPGELKTAITSSAVGSSTPGILTAQRMNGIVKPGVARIRVRDLLQRFPTGSNAVEFVKENTYTNAASPTAETISKPESALTFTTESVGVKTVAHWIPAAKQVLDPRSGSLKPPAACEVADN